MAKITTFIKKPPQKEELSEAPQVEELLKNLEFHNAIQALSNRILNAESLSEIIVSVKEDIRALFNIHILTIYLVDKANKEIYTMEAKGGDVREVRLPLDFSTFAGYVAQKKKLLYVADAYNDRDLKKIHERLSFDPSLDRKTGVLTGQIIATPILFEGIVLGVMEIMNKKGGAKIEDYHQIYLDEIAGVLSRAFDNHLNFQQLAQKFKTRFAYLLKKGFLSEAQVEKALRESRLNNQSMETIFIDKYGLDKNEIGKALADHYRCAFVAFDPNRPVPFELLTGLDHATLESLCFVPLDIADGKIRVIIDDPSDTTRRKKIESLLETAAVIFDVALPSDIIDFLHLFFQGARHSDQELLSDDELNPDETAEHEDAAPIIVASPEPATLHGKDYTSDESEDALIPDEEKAPAVHRNISGAAEKSVPPIMEADEASPAAQETSPAAKEASNDAEPPAVLSDSPAFALAGRIIQEAYGRRATDLHFEPDASTKTTAVRARINGRLLTLQSLSQSDYQSVLGQIKTMANLYDGSKDALLTARLRMIKPSGDELPMRLVIVPTAGGQEDAVIHFSTRLALMPLEHIGLSEHQYDALSKVIEHPRGLILMTGPAGSGLTTTMHACLKRILSSDKIVWTAEQPLEILQPGLRQVSVDSGRGMSFSSVLRSLMSADPDVIAAGAIPDSDAAVIGSQAALQGRLFFGVMTTENFSETLEKLIDMGLTRLMLSDSLLAVVSQRLVHTLCPRCKQKYSPGREEYEDLADRYGREAFEKLNMPYNDDFVLWRPAGCDECNQTGYSGRTGIFEILAPSNSVKRMIRRNESLEAVYAAALAEGTTTLYQDWIGKILDGRTDAARLRQTLAP
ncbi:MAG TPA: ATPase, T2SS/T4P/T4SS family [Smithellaceae bacterium]|nr:ATPase, T2SS/T4P/T4SS family [Smithellaceae bacterium]